MAEGSIAIQASIGGVSVQKTITRDADHPNPYEVTLAVAHAVGGWVKTDANTAAGTLTASHGQTTGTYDVYWTGGARYDVAVTVTVNAIALEGGSGTDFPATADATVVICKQVQINTAIDGDSIQLGVVCLEYGDTAATSVGGLLFEDAASDVILDLEVAANVPQVYDIAGGQTNPFTGDPIATCMATHSNTTYAATCKIAMLEDSTP